MAGRLGRAAVGGCVGLLAAAAALGVGELVAAFVRPAAAPVIAVGNKFVLLTPEWLKEVAVRRFGSNDKAVLLAGIDVVIGLLAIVLGVLARRRLWIGVVGFTLFGLVGGYAAATANAARASDVVPTVAGTIAAVTVLVALVRAAAGQDPRPWRGWQEPPAPAAGTERRIFLTSGMTVAATAALAGFGGRALQRARFAATQSRAAVRLPAPASPAPPLPPGADLGKGAASFVTPVNRFYRVDTALTVPQLDARRWRLRVHGMVDHELTLTYDDLLARPLIERYVTLACVSNYVGGPYISTARFLGARLADVLREAGVHPAADQIVGRSSDGMTVGTPTAIIMDGRDAMLAVGMDGEPLPIQHGFPVRTVVPGLYGYVSATKWLIDLEATTFADFDPYWVQRGWARTAPVLLESRIDTPQSQARLAVGQRVTIAGVAWHQHVGVRGVQLQIGDGPWQDARLGRVPSTDTWVQWVLPWTVAGAGTVRIRVRAVDATGSVQADTTQDPFPSGANAWHTIAVTVQ